MQFFFSREFVPQWLSHTFSRIFMGIMNCNCHVNGGPFPFVQSKQILSLFDKRLNNDLMERKAENKP